jgi:putative transposase
MTATLDDVANKKLSEVTAEQQAATELVRMAKEQGLSLTGPDGLLKRLTKSVVETALDEEMTEHLGYAKHDRARIGAENIGGGTRSRRSWGQHRLGSDRCASGPGRDVRAADR